MRRSEVEAAHSSAVIGQYFRDSFTAKAEPGDLSLRLAHGSSARRGSGMAFISSREHCAAGDIISGNDVAAMAALRPVYNAVNLQG